MAPLGRFAHLLGSSLGPRLLLDQVDSLVAKILVVDDDADLAGMVQDWLTHQHHTVELANNGTDASERLKFYEYDVIVLDWDLPGISGIDVLKEYRDAGGLTPVLMLTGKKSIDDKEKGFDCGADDYLTKPFNMRELSARVSAVLRRAAGQTSSMLQAGDLVLDPTSFKVTRRGEEIHLRKQEFALLEFLIRNQDRVFSPEALLERVWRSESDAGGDAIRSCMKRLRQKIDGPGQESLIRTVHGVGYKLTTK